MKGSDSTLKKVRCVGLKGNYSGNWDFMEERNLRVP